MTGDAPVASFSKALEEGRVSLYHRINDGGSARVRRLLVELGVSDKVSFRNVGLSEAAMSELKQIAKSDRVPVLIVHADSTADGSMRSHWYDGADAIEFLLRSPVSEAGSVSQAKGALKR